MIMDAAIALSNARRGFLVLWDKGEAKIVRARNIEKVAIDSPEATISRHLIREAVDRRETVVTAEAAIERGGYASTTGLDLKSVMVSPLLSRGRVIGAIYLDDPEKVGVFQSEDVRTLEAFCDQAAIALTNAYKMEEVNQRLESQRFRLKRIEHEVRKKDQEEVRRFGNLVGASPAMRKVFDLLNRVAESSFPIVIAGRVRRRQGARRQGDPLLRDAQGRPLRGGELRRRPGDAPRRGSSSATWRAPSPAPSATGRASSSSRTAARSSSTRSAR